MKSDWIALLTALADSADAIARRYFRSPALEVERKPGGSLVTNADPAIEQTIIAELQARHPSLGILGEEFGVRQGDGSARLIVDPIDATSNYVRGIPVFATLLAIEAAGEIEAGLVSAPALDRRWWATRGGGAYENGVAIRVSDIGDLAQAQVFHSGFDLLHGSLRSGFLRLCDATWRQRGFGDFYQHLLVAAGCGEIAIDPEVQPWDVAPLLVILEEAGGKATSLSGERTIYGGSLLTTNSRLHAQALAYLTAPG